jgi:hypothetical protein
MNIGIVRGRFRVIQISSCSLVLLESSFFMTSPAVELAAMNLCPKYTSPANGRKISPTELKCAAGLGNLSAHETITSMINEGPLTPVA